MSRIVSTKKFNAGFLAIVLIAGTLVAISPSFIIGAHAQQYGTDQQKYNSYEPDYGMDNSYDNKQSYGKYSNSYDKSKDSSSVIKKKIKCNNINVNVNGFNGVEVGTLPTALTDLATGEAQASADEDELGASSSGSGSGRPSGSDNDSRFVCIDNNDFSVTEGNGDETDPCGDAIEACFNQFLGRDLTLILKGELESPAGVTIDINGAPVTLHSFGDICTELAGLTFEQLFVAIGDIIREAGIITMIDIALIECIAGVLNIVNPG